MCEHVCRMRLSLKWLTSLGRLYQLEDQLAECYWTGEELLLIALYATLQCRLGAVLHFCGSCVLIWESTHCTHVGNVQVVDSSGLMLCPTFSVLEIVCPFSVVLLLCQLSTLQWVVHVWHWACTCNVLCSCRLLKLSASGRHSDFGLCTVFWFSI